MSSGPMSCPYVLDSTVTDGGQTRRKIRLSLTLFSEDLSTHSVVFATSVLVRHSLSSATSSRAVSSLVLMRRCIAMAVLVALLVAIPIATLIAATPRLALAWSGKAAAQAAAEVAVEAASGRGGARLDASHARIPDASRSQRLLLCECAVRRGGGRRRAHWRLEAARGAVDGAGPW